MDVATREMRYGRLNHVDFRHQRDDVLEALLLLLMLVAGLAHWRLWRLRRDLGRLEMLVQELAGGPTAASAAGAASAAPEPGAPKPAPDEAEPAPAPEPAAPADSAGRGGWPSAGDWAALGQQPTAGTPPPAADAIPTPSFEERLTSRWLVWLGAGTMALAAVFLVRHAFERGLIGPGARVLLGLALGTLLVAAGEWLARRPATRALAARRPDHVPGALVAAGIAAFVASIYAAFGLYGLIPAAAAFIGLGVTALAAVALALRHGPLVATVGLIAGYATPALVHDPATVATALPVFLHLAVLTTALALYATWTRSWLFTWATAAGALLWPVLWLDAAYTPGDAPALGAYLVGVAAIALLPASRLEPAQGRWARIGDPTLLILVWWGAVALALMALAGADARGPASLWSMGGFALLGFLAAWRLPPPGQHPVMALAIAIAAVIVLLATWPLPPPGAGAWLPPEGPWREPVLPLPASGFVLNTALHALLFGLGGFLVLARSTRPVLWAAVSTSVPLILLALTYWRLTGLAVDLRWPPSALALAGLAVLAAGHFRQRLPEGIRDEVVALYAAAATAGLALAATMALREAWLTVALALELPALGWIATRLDSRRLRQLAMALAGIVLARLVLNPFVLDYAPGTMPGLDWVLYGYGLPAIAFFIAARLFRRRAEDALTALLDGGAITFTALLLTLQIQLAVAGRIGSWPDDLLALALQSITWLVVAEALHRDTPWFQRPVVVWLRRALITLAMLQAVLLQAGVFNPLWWPTPVGTLPLLNLLLPAYAIPALLLARVASREPASPLLARAAATVALLLAFVFVNLSVRHAFHGTRLDLGGVSDAEWLSYSAAWLACAAALLAWGILRRSVTLRWVSLGLVLATVLKVFLLDMDGLEGFWRVASFLGLGLSLVAIGFVYQRLVFRPAAGA